MRTHVVYVPSIFIPVLFYRQELRAAHNERSSGAPNLHVAGKNYHVKIPSALVKSLFAPIVDKISACLDGLKRNPSLAGLKYAFMVGGFSACSLLQAAAKASLDDDECRRVLVAFRPDVAIVKGAVLYANNAEVFTTRIAPLTYGVRTLGQYDGSDPGHVSHRPKYPHFDDEHNELFPLFSAHVKVGDEIPPDRACPRVCYYPLSERQPAVTIPILASHQNDVKFPDEGTTFPLGKVTVPVYMATRYEDRGVDVEFDFRGTELSVNCFAAARGTKVGNVLLELMQEAVRTG